MWTAEGEDLCFALALAQHGFQLREIKHRPKCCVSAIKKKEQFARALSRGLHAACLLFSSPPSRQNTRRPVTVSPLEIKPGY